MPIWHAIPTDGMDEKNSRPCLEEIAEPCRLDPAWPRRSPPSRWVAISAFATCSTRVMKVDLELTIDRVERHYAVGDSPYVALIIDGLGKVGLPE